MRTHNLDIIAATITACLALSISTTPLAHAYVSPATATERAGRVTRAFYNPEHDWLPGHRGVDLAMQPGAAVVAAGDGEVSYVGVIAGVPVISIDHPDGLRTTYQPVHPVVSSGEAISEGQVIGTLSPGHTPQHGLHWGVRTGPKRYINPLSLLRSPVIRLKPVRPTPGA